MKLFLSRTSTVSTQRGSLLRRDGRIEQLKIRRYGEGNVQWIKEGRKKKIVILEHTEGYGVYGLAISFSFGLVWSGLVMWHVFTGSRS